MRRFETLLTHSALVNRSYGATFPRVSGVSEGARWSIAERVSERMSERTSAAERMSERTNGLFFTASFQTDLSHSALVVSRTREQGKRDMDGIHRRMIKSETTHVAITPVLQLLSKYGRRH